jgi:hypothetical protein
MLYAFFWVIPRRLKLISDAGELPKRKHETRNCTTYETPSHTQNHETKWPLALTTFETAFILSVSLLDAKFP